MKRRPPQRKRKRNPEPAASPRVARDYAHAVDLYQRFSGHDGAPLATVPVPNAPKVAIVVGYCDGVLYSTVRDGKPEKYIHEFAKRDRPLLLVTPKGERVILYGGNYTFTERGIVDRSDRRNRS